MSTREELTRQAEKWLRQGRTDQAIDLYKQIAHLSPTDWNQVKQCADLLERAGQRESAGEQFLRLADHLCAEGFHSKASALYKKVLKLNAGHERALWQLGEVSLELDLRADARQAFQRVLDLRQRRGDTPGAAAARTRLDALDGAAPGSGAGSGASARSRDLQRAMVGATPADVTFDAPAIDPAAVPVESSLVAAAEPAFGAQPPSEAIAECIDSCEPTAPEPEYLEAEPPTLDSRLPTPNSRLPTPDSRFPIPDSPLLAASAGSGETDTPDAAVDIMQDTWDNGSSAFASWLPTAVAVPPAFSAPAPASSFDWAGLLGRSVDEGRVQGPQMAETLDPPLADADGRARSPSGPSPSPSAPSPSVPSDVLPEFVWEPEPAEAEDPASPDVVEPDVLAEAPEPGGDIGTTEEPDADDKGDEEIDLTDLLEQLKQWDPVLPEPLRSKSVESPSSSAEVGPARRAGRSSTPESTPELRSRDQDEPADDHAMAGRARSPSGPCLPAESAMAAAAGEADMDSVFADLQQQTGGRTVAEQQLAAGRVFAAAGLLAEAARAFERASPEPRTRFSATQALAELHRSRGQLEEAVSWFEQAAMAPVPDAAMRRAVLYDLAESLEELGEPERALGVLLDLLSQVEDYRDARTRVDRLLRVDAGG